MSLFFYHSTREEKERDLKERPFRAKLKKNLTLLIIGFFGKEKKLRPVLVNV